jgi:cysteine-rich repeat protein
MIGPRVAAAATSDGFVAVWAQRDVRDSLVLGEALMGQALSPSGAPQGRPFHIAELSEGHPWLDVAIDQHGRGAVAWLDRDDQANQLIRVATFDPGTGEASPATVVRTATQDDHLQFVFHIAAGPEGFLVVWSEGGPRPTVWGQLLTTCGNGLPESSEECDDANQRDGDCCSATCRLEDLPGSCWRLAGERLVRFSATVRAGGRTAVCKARCRTTSEDTLILLDDGTYRWPNGEVSCLDGDTRDIADETGRRTGNEDRERLRPLNLGAVRGDIEVCTGRRLRQSRTVLEVGGGALRGKQMQTVRVPDAEEPTVTLRSTLEFVGVPLGSVRPEPPTPNPSVDECQAEVRLRCRVP